MTKETFYLTTAISYPNGDPHIGHAYEALASDSLARFKRLDGYDVFFLTGTDEHGLKMQQTAIRDGVAPRELVARMTPKFQRMVELLDCSVDDFIRTTEPRHRRTVEALWQRMVDAGDIYLDKYTGWYSVRDEAYYGADEIEERDGRRIAIKSGTPVEWVEEESYFFRLASYQARLLEHYEAHPEFISPPERRNEILSFVRGGLQDLSVSRTTFDWGIPVPGAPGHIMYVWVDALTNYLSATGWPDPGPRNRYWPADLHVIGKDIVRFHTVYWPAFLMSAGLPVPKRVFGHGFLFNRGEKMSKSVGNVIAPDALVARYGVDPLRYFFLREVPFGQDGNYSHEAIINRVNADLANDLGNLAQRSLSMIARNCDGRIPAPAALTAADRELLAAADALLVEVRAQHEVQAINRALDAIWKVVADANRYFAAQEPWALRRSDPARMASVLYVTAEVLRQIGILVQPYMPQSAAKLLDLLAVDPDRRKFADLATRLAAQVELPEPRPIFPRIAGLEEAVEAPGTASG
jgi:methionyl-tRNA synthetase